MTHRDIIKTLGGPSAFARMLGLHPDLAVKWNKRGIPPRHWYTLAVRPEVQSAGITIDDFVYGAHVNDHQGTAQ